MVLVLVAGYFGARVLRTLIEHLEHVLVVAGERTGALPGVTRSRVTTLTSVLRTLALVGLWSVVVVICLSQLGYDVRPILAGAGIVGLAVGFGAQHLVRDVIAGFFLVLEDQVRVGDVAVVNGTGGLVETVTFRTIVLRDLAGTVHIFPNGSVTTLANMTKDWSGYVVDVEVGYQEDTDRIVALMRRVFEELRRDPTHGPLIIEPIEIFGVDAFKDSTVVIKARLKTVPIQQWTVGPRVPAPPPSGLRGRGRRGSGAASGPGRRRRQALPVAHDAGPRSTAALRRHPMTATVTRTPREDRKILI